MAHARLPSRAGAKSSPGVVIVRPRSSRGQAPADDPITSDGPVEAWSRPDPHAHGILDAPLTRGMTTKEIPWCLNWRPSAPRVGCPGMDRAAAAGPGGAEVGELGFEAFDLEAEHAAAGERQRHHATGRIGLFEL